ncbi:MAG: SWIM zinc finger family protein, partial [Candidatus Solibacter sp.]
MPLASKLAFQFERRLQFKGDDLYRAHAVRITEANQSHLYGEVQGTNRYTVRLTHEDKRLMVFCSCPYFETNSRCKHLWAAILEADRRGVLGTAVQAPTLRLFVEEDEAESEAESEVESADEFILGTVPRYVPPQMHAPAWQEYLTDIRHSLDARKVRVPTWPRDLEIHYVVDTAASRVANTLVLELFSRSRKKNGDWTVHKEFRITPAQVGSLPDPVDAEVIASILGGQEYYIYAYSGATGSAARKAVPYPLAVRIIPMIAGTGRLFVRKPGSTVLNPLAWDEGEAWKLWLDVRQDDRDQWKITGSLRRAEERMELARPDLIVEGGFLSADGKLARLDDGGAFPWITRLLALKRIPFPDRERDAVMSMV